MIIVFLLGLIVVTLQHEAVLIGIILMPLVIIIVALHHLTHGQAIIPVVQLRVHVDVLVVIMF